ncbi:indolepyruvate oxidoreductase subunit beta family protein [Marinibaculum pumilum]|uniref:Indolepyruvate oxidoreductase subunit beta family protein n=1 Tax=Marinibaculum pumilum TaxID=1766165 RepID=A0ABV7L1Z7_9PROT
MSAATESTGSAGGATAARQRIIKLAVLAVGGQGGGVLSDWITATAEENGWRAQSTSVPGVAQRTGATVYYIEMVPDEGRQPVFSLMPTPGDVDIVVAAELMEAGRAIQRGFVTADRTTLITSTHRALALIEKAEPGDGIRPNAPVLDIARRSCARLIAADMERLARSHGSMISASLFGALAGAGVLPFTAEQFKETIRAGGRGVEASLRAFDAGRTSVELNPEPAASEDAACAPAAPSDPAGPKALQDAYAALTARVASYPAPAQAMLAAGLQKVVDFQDLAYGAEYLDRVDAVLALDKRIDGGSRNFLLTVDAAKYIANAMAYDDVVRVADLKTRASRFARVRAEMGVGEGQVLHTTEFMHPRMEEVCGTLPAGLGRWIEARPGLMRNLDRLVNRGRRVRTDGLFWFLMLYGVGGLRRWRRGMLRHKVEQAHLEAWLAEMRRVAEQDYDLAVEVLRCRRLVKGYSDTHARGESKFARVIGAIPLVEGRPDAADWIRRLRELALKDEAGEALDGGIRTLREL